MKFFLVGVNFKRRSPQPEERVQKIIGQLSRRYPGLTGRIASVPFFTPPVEGLLISPPKDNPLSPEQLQLALEELGYSSTVHHLSSSSDGLQPDAWIDPESLRLLESGKSFCRLGLLEEARIQLQQAIQRDAACVEAYHYLTAVLRRQGKGQEAVQWLQLALESTPDEASVHFLYAELCNDLGQMVDAVQHLKQAIRLKPEASSPYVKLGEVFQRLGQAEQARLAFEEGLTRDPNSADAAAGLGSLLLGEGRMAAAIDFLHKALQENEQLHEARLQLGWCLFHTGRPRQAEVEFLRVIHEGDPAFLVAARFSLGRLYAHLGEHENAAELLKDVLERQPELAEAHHLLAGTLSEMEQHETALKHWMETLKLQPQREAELRPQLALCYSRLNQHAVAEKLARQALDELGPRPNLYELLASIYMAQDEWELALQTLRKGEVLEPDSALISFQIGWAFENLEQGQQAEAYYSRALRLDPSLVEAYTGLGWLYYERGQYDVALVLFEKASELQPEDPEAADHVGWAHLMLKQPAQALEHFRRALEQEPYSEFYRTHLAAALFHLGRFEDCRSTVELLQSEPLDEFLRTFSDYLLDQVRRQLGEPTRALSARRMKLLPQEFVALTGSSGRNLARPQKWTEFRGTGKKETERKKRSSQS